MPSSATAVRAEVPCARRPVPPGAVRITGGRRLSGRVRVAGSVGAARILLAAAAAQMRPILLERVPDCPAVDECVTLLNRYGWRIETDTGRLCVRPGTFDEMRYAREPLDATVADLALCLAPALVQALGYAVVPWPAAGRASADPDVRRVYEQFGDEVTANEHGYVIVAGPGRPQHLEISLERRSQAATITALIRAAATGTKLTLINRDHSLETNALWAALHQAGCVGTVTTDRLELLPLRGRWSVDRWQVPSDGFEAGLYACAIAATGGRGSIEAAPVHDLRALRAVIEHTGIHIQHGADETLRVEDPGRSRSRFAAREGIGAVCGTGPTDLDPRHAPALLALALAAPGRHRLATPDDAAHLIAPLARLGAQITASPGGGLEWAGPQRLIACPVEAGEVREAEALIVAALATDGTTELTGLGPLMRDHPGLLENLVGLGARIEPLG